MPLAAGSRLGPYEIQALIGAGGMGEVYRARDTRLDRTVAIKVVSPELAADIDRRVRFEREARAVAQLSHPHICTLHDIGEDHGTTYLVMEHLAGESLADRLRRGPIPLDQVLAYGAQIAAALGAAHKADIIHRDLKPANVMVTRSGAKLLDFGLAKLRSHEGVRLVADSSTAATQVRDVTTAGTLVGTLPYMAPEQIEGREADARTDVWALGCLLYELATGRPAFEGATTGILVGAVLAKDPPRLTTLQPLAPPAFERIVHKCLQKDPDARWQSAADLADELGWVLGSPGETSPAAPIARPTRRRRMAFRSAALAFGCIGVAVVLWSLRTGSGAPPIHVERVGLSLAQQALAAPTDLAISPDGRAIVFASMQGQTRRLFVRTLDRWESRMLEGTEAASDPSFSPDGRWVAFASPMGLQRVALEGGPPVPIYAKKDDTRIAGQFTAWDSAGRVVFSSFGAADSGLSRVSVDGGTPQVLAHTGDTSVRYLHPQVLPGGRAILFTIFKRGRASIAALSLDTGAVKIVREGGSRGRYIEGLGYLVYQADGQLFGVRFDPERLETGGTLQVVAEGVGNSDVLHAEYDISTAGTLAYLPPADVRLSWIDRVGVRTVVAIEKRAQSGWVAVSADGRRAVVALAKGHARQVYVANLDGEVVLTRLTPGDDDYYGVFTPDGQQVLFTAPGQGSGYNIYSTRADAGGVPTRQTSGPSWQAASSILRDRAGDILLYDDRPGVGDAIDIWQQRMGRPERAQAVIKTPTNERSADFSPDGHWIAYISDESGQDEVYVRAYPAGPKNQVSPDGASGSGLRWNPLGGELFYEKSPAVFAVRVVNGVRVGQPQRLFERPAYGRRNWDVAPDGQRFLVAESTRPAEVNVVTNWVEELKAKVPAK